MLMAAQIIINNRTQEVPADVSIGDAVRSLGLMPDAFVFIMNGRPVPMDTPIADGTTINAIKVASGG